MTQYTTQMDAARQGIITPQMEIVAEKEHFDVEELRELIAKGQVIIPCNKNHKSISPSGVGAKLTTKINVNLGVSRDWKDADLPNEYRHEPELGLASGTDGLKLTRRILGNAADYLADDGVLICEVGNSMVHLMEQYPDVPFTWLEFDNGGDGVFMLTKEQLLAAREHFAIYKD